MAIDGWVLVGAGWLCVVNGMWGHGVVAYCGEWHDAWCCRMVLLHGGVAWCCRMVLWLGMALHKVDTEVQRLGAGEFLYPHTDTHVPLQPPCCTLNA